MTRPVRPDKVLPYVGILAAPAAGEDALFERISAELFALITPEGPFPFEYTGYYEREMGPGLKRYWALGARCCNPDELVGHKLKATELERKLSVGGRRRVNLDPGYIGRHSVVAATSKALPAAVYLREGVYGYLLLLYREGTFVPLDWTYPDYRDHVAFFNAGRRAMIGMLRSLK